MIAIGIYRTLTTDVQRATTLGISIIADTESCCSSQNILDRLWILIG